MLIDNIPGNKDANLISSTRVPAGETQAAVSLWDNLPPINPDFVCAHKAPQLHGTSRSWNLIFWLIPHFQSSHMERVCWRDPHNLLLIPVYSLLFAELCDWHPKQQICSSANPPFSHPCQECCSLWSHQLPCSAVVFSLHGCSRVPSPAGCLSALWDVNVPVLLALLYYFLTRCYNLEMEIEDALNFPPLFPMVGVGVRYWLFLRMDFNCSVKTN